MTDLKEIDLSELRRTWANRRAALHEILARIDQTGLVRPARDSEERAWLDERGGPLFTEDEAMAAAARAYYERRYRR